LIHSYPNAELERLKEFKQKVQEAYYVPPLDIPPMNANDKIRVCSDIRKLLKEYSDG